MSRFHHTLRSFALLACLALLLASVGCNEGSVLAPVDGPGGVSSGPSLYGISSTPDDPVFVKADKVDGAVVLAKEGGSISNGRVSLEFPAGALNEDTYITMTMDKSNLVVQFQPEGLVFNTPVTITWKLAGTVRDGRAGSTVIKYRNPATELLEDIRNVPDDHPNRVKGFIEHFSEYDLIGG
jgi:hypothetical protein